MKPIHNYYGGKVKMAPAILPLIPDHRIYVEPFCGSAVIFWAKEAAEIEVLNDLDGDIINFYKVCQTRFSSLKKLTSVTPFSRKEHNLAKAIKQNPGFFSPLNRAWAWWTLTTQGFSGKWDSWGYSKSRRLVKSYNTRQLNFSEKYSERLKNVEFESNDALQIIKSRDTKDTFFYLDPPYYNSNCGPYAGYSIDDFKALLELISTLKGKFILSSYPSEILEEYSRRYNWNTNTFNMQVSAGLQNSKRKIEVLTTNFPI